MYKILLIEDDIDICEIIKLYLSDTNYNISIVNSANEALNIVDKESFDLILLDIMLPDIDGINLCFQLRKDIYCPIIFISCIDDDATIIKALEMGGDDYLVKPFNCHILIAKIGANIRRVCMERENSISENILQLKKVGIEPSDHTILKNGNKIYLTPIEFKILTYMVSNPNRILTLEEIYNNIWNEPSYDDVRTVKVHVSNLRKKIEDNPSEPEYIKTVRRVGYFFSL